MLASLLCAHTAGATEVLYANDFETPNVPIAVNCGNSLDSRTIDQLFGTADFKYAQVNTVEGVSLQDPAGLYKNPAGTGGKYAIGMLSAYQDDKLGLTFDAGKRAFVNVAFDLSSIDVQGCGGPFGVDKPVMRVSLVDSPGNVFSWSGTVLSQAELTGVAAPDAWTFAWSRIVASLDASGSTDGHITVVFDLLKSGYGSFDNLSITAADTAGVVDTDVDSTADDTDNCPDEPNRDQANEDRDLAGDVCDPAPKDPTLCGDRDNDGKDDCAKVVDAGIVDARAPDAADAPDAQVLDAALPDSGAAGAGEGGASSGGGGASSGGGPVADSASSGGEVSGDADATVGAGGSKSHEEIHSSCSCRAVGSSRAPTLPLATTLLVALLSLRRKSRRS